MSHKFLSFLSNRVHFFIIHPVLQIGELTTRLSDDFKEKFSEIAWSEIKALRNIHVHEYEKVDFEEMLKIFQNDIPDLKEKLQKILSEID